MSEVEYNHKLTEPAIITSAAIALKPPAQPYYSGFVSQKQESTYYKFITKLVQILSIEMLKFKQASVLNLGKFI